MVGAEGFEPSALCSQSRCATRLRYAPTVWFDCIANRFTAADGGATDGQPGKVPNYQQRRNGEDERLGRGQQKHKTSVACGEAARLFQVTAEQKLVAAVGLPGDFE